jgi:hypothetical protein
MTIRSFFPAFPARLAARVLTIVILSAQTAGADQHGRLPSPGNGDPCGLPDTTTAAYRAAAAQNWGYGYDSLRADLARWSASPYVRIDSVGASVQNRALTMLTIQATGESAQPRRRIWIHARTHPGEVQGTWVTNHIIAQLLGTSDIADRLRRSCVFNIIPMINPDGVELKYARQNAHGIDIESNWNAIPGEPEVQTLRRMFGTFMAEPNPILIALNMHSAYGEKRYFVYHAAAGTSPSYAAIEQRFINGVRGHFPGGIQPHDYFVSWTTAPSLVYPESWFWLNHRESVLALTYEDMNSTAARAFDSTANALLRGIADELGVTGTTPVADSQERPSTLSLEQNFPNPFNPSTTIRFSVPAAGGDSRASQSQQVRLGVFDLMGREVTTLVNEVKAPGTYEVRFDGSALASGVYFCRLQVQPPGPSAGHGGTDGAPVAPRLVRMLLTK